MFYSYQQQQQVLSYYCNLKQINCIFFNTQVTCAFANHIEMIGMTERVVNVCRFAVNLRHQQQGGDIAFHFNPRIKERVVVRNSLLSSSWGQEERNQPSFPFQAGQQFTMIILCEPTEFKVTTCLYVVYLSQRHISTKYIVTCAVKLYLHEFAKFEIKCQ